jgi:methylenetetrahydrofolate reductase (NADPH)
MSSLDVAPLSVRSVELSTNKRELLERAALALPEGTLVYVPKLPKRSHADGLAPIRQLKELGLRPVPHIAARSLASQDELEAFMRAVSASGVDRVLVIGGDASDPAGPFPDSAAVLASGGLSQAGITHVDVAGYPDGHPTIPEATLRADLGRKVETADRQGLSLTVITQFSFVPEGVADYCATLATTVPGIPVHAGIVGPTSLHRLLQFARICGVSTSLRAVEKFGLGNLRLVTHADPGRQAGVLDRLRWAGRAGNLAGLHLFTFGGFAEGAEWLRDQRAG